MNSADCAARTNWNFEFARTAKIFNTKFTNSLKNVNVYYQRLLTFAQTNWCRTVLFIQKVKNEFTSTR